MASVKLHKGFTLIELMIAIAVIGILVGIAIPNYSEYLKKSRMQEAFTTLSDLRIKLEQRYQDFRNYGTTASACPVEVTLPTGTSAQYFTFSCKQRTDGDNANTNQSYILTATGKNSLTGYDYTINEINEKKTTTFKGSASTKSCWLSGGSEC